MLYICKGLDNVMDRKGGGLGIRVRREIGKRVRVGSRHFGLGREGMGLLLQQSLEMEI